jgi:competence protein ComEA
MKESYMKKLLLVLVACFAFAINAFAAVNINSASQAELETIKGIGPVKAKAIIDYRTKNGAFKSVDDLDNVKGIGKKSVDKFRSEVSVSGATTAAPAAAAKAKPAAPEAAAPAAKPADAKASKKDEKKK